MESESSIPFAFKVELESHVSRLVVVEVDEEEADERPEEAVVLLLLVLEEEVILAVVVVVFVEKSVIALVDGVDWTTFCVVVVVAFVE